MVIFSRKATLELAMFVRLFVRNVISTFSWINFLIHQLCHPSSFSSSNFIHLELNSLRLLRLFVLFLSWVLGFDTNNLIANMRDMKLLRWGTIIPHPIIRFYLEVNQIVLFPLHHKLNIWWKDRIKHQQSFTESQENKLKTKWNQKNKGGVGV